MADTQAQQKWRDKHRFTKSQLNVMARKNIHGFLTRAVARFGLKGKGEAVAFDAYVVETLTQQAETNPEKAAMLETIHQAYLRDRDLYAP